jgi:hypothetical protein
MRFAYCANEFVADIASIANIAKIANIANIEMLGQIGRRRPNASITQNQNCQLEAANFQAAELSRAGKALERGPSILNVGNVGNLGNVGNANQALRFEKKC